MSSVLLHNIAVAVAARLGELQDWVYHSPVREMKRRALAESCDYIEANMPEAIGLQNQAACLRFGLSKVGPVPGAYMEFGVHRGATIRIIGACAGKERRVHGFDSFEGLPTDWFGNTLKAGDFDVGGKLPRVHSNTTLYKGWFDATLPAWCESHEDKVAFLNIDSDLYSSAKLVLNCLKDRLQAGTVIHFDEYINYPGWRHHEFRAWAEFVKAYDIKYTYLAYSRWGVLLRIDQIGPESEIGAAP